MLAKLRATTFAVVAFATALPLVVWAQGYDHDHDLARDGRHNVKMPERATSHAAAKAYAETRVVMASR